MIRHLLPLLVTVAWLFEEGPYPGYFDRLEYQTEVNGAWIQVPGVYPVVNGEYNVYVPNDTPLKFFRVNRRWKFFPDL